MKIYIGSSWKNQHGVEMLTALLRGKGHEVKSWVENNYGENHNHVTKKLTFEDWVATGQAVQAFEFDTSGAVDSELFIYYAPAGNDCSAELGAAWSAGVMTFGLIAKGDNLGLMRMMVNHWYDRYTDLLLAIEQYQIQLSISEKALSN